MTNTLPDAEAVLAFWLGDVDEHGFSPAAKVQSWWKKDAAFDAELRKRFGALHEAVRSGACDDWLTSARGRLAYVIVLDQFSRNMFRDTPGAFASDARALEVAGEGIELGHDRELQGPARSFLYMPFMHAEDLMAQTRCVELFEAFAGELEGEHAKSIGNNVDFAEKHRVIIERFGRFPHRNAILGRASTAEEDAFLKEPGSSF